MIQPAFLSRINSESAISSGTTLNTSYDYDHFLRVVQDGIDTCCAEGRYEWRLRHIGGFNLHKDRMIEELENSGYCVYVVLGDIVIIWNDDFEPGVLYANYGPHIDKSYKSLSI